MSSSRTGHVSILPFVVRLLYSMRTWALDVADDTAGCVVHELYANLGHATTRTCVMLAIPPLISSTIHPDCERTGAAEHSCDLDELDGDPVHMLVWCAPIWGEVLVAHLAESMFARMRKFGGGMRVVSLLFGGRDAR